MYLLQFSIFFCPFINPVFHMYLFAKSLLLCKGVKTNPENAQISGF